MNRRLAPLLVLGAACATATSNAPAPNGYFWPARPVGAVHTIMPSPTTVVYGGYDPAA